MRFCTRCRTGILICLLICLVPRPGAARAPRVATVSRGTGAGSDKAAALVGHYARELLGRDERFEVVDVSKSLGNQDRDKALRAFAAAEEQVQRGRAAYDTLELDAAVLQLNGAIARYERFPGYVQDFRKVAEAMMLVGATHILRGDDKLGVRRLQQAIAVYPQVEPDPRIFNPGMRNVFQASLTKARARGAGSFSLTSNPSYAEAYVNGKFVGTTPLALDKLSEGRHWVRLEKDGFRAWGKVVDIKGHAETAETAQLQPTSHYEDYDNLVEMACKRLPAPAEAEKAGARSEVLEQLGELCGAEEAFVLQVRLDGERVQVQAYQYNLAGRRVVRAGEHVFAYDTRIEVYEREVTALLHHLFSANDASDDRLSDTKGGRGPKIAKGADGPVDKDKQKADAAAAASTEGLMHAGQATCLWGMSCKTLKVTGVAVGLGAGGALMAAGGVHWFLAKRDHNTYRTLPQTADDSPTLMAQGKNYALRGDVLFGIGAGFAAAGLAALMFWDPVPSAVDVLEHNAPKTALRVLPAPGGGMVSAAITF